MSFITIEKFPLNVASSIKLFMDPKQTKKYEASENICSNVPPIALRIKNIIPK